MQKLVSTNNGTSYVAQTTNKFVYDGWNPIAILDGQSALVQALAWGMDMSGTMQGAGGVGGLLLVSDATNGVHFVAMDGNGNVAGTVNALDGSETLRCEYEPFGKPLRVTGKLAKTFGFGFSTKYYDAETEENYYGYRFYNPNAGRWLSRDPIEERGGVNLFGFVGNDSVSSIDVLGLKSDPAFDEALRMWGHLYYGDLSSDYQLSAATLQIARQRVRDDMRFVELAKNASNCDKAGNLPVNQYDGIWSIADQGAVHIGGWQARFRGNLSWKCSSKRWTSSKSRCCCDCSATLQLKVYIQKTYTFRPFQGYNPYNDSLPIQGLNGWAIDYQVMTHGVYWYDSNGPGYFVHAEWEDRFAIPFQKCPQPIQ